ncbi:MAG: tRNA (cytidine(34)-2'-O)-methyltransferase [Acidobacteriota bacterium]
MSPTIHAVLVEPEIHWNAGNVGRTCLAAGAQLHLVEPLGFELSDRRVRRAGLDYWPRVQPHLWSCWEEFHTATEDLGELFFFAPEGRRDLWSADYGRNPVLIFGRESTGLPRPLLERFAERTVAVPMADPELRSLNLSTTVALALYEVLRQRQASSGSASSANSPSTR